MHTTRQSVSVPGSWYLPPSDAARLTLSLTSCTTGSTFSREDQEKSRTVSAGQRTGSWMGMWQEGSSKSRRNAMHGFERVSATVLSKSVQLSTFNLGAWSRIALRFCRPMSRPQVVNSMSSAKDVPLSSIRLDSSKEASLRNGMRSM
jgi:hypothetical protein